MRPRGVRHIRIAAAYPYRAHWNASNMSDDDLFAIGTRKWGGGQNDFGSREEAIKRARRLLENAREGSYEEWR